MLGRLRMSVGQCINGYAEFSKQVFGDLESGWKFKDGKFKAVNLVTAIQDTIRRQDQEDRMRDHRKDACKVFVPIFFGYFGRC